MRMVILAAGLGTRVRAVSGDRPKTFLQVGPEGETILGRLLDFAAEIGLDPLIVTRPELASHFEPYAELFLEEEPVGMLTTLYQARHVVSEPFVWVASDMVFSDHALLERLVAEYEPETFASFFFARTERFKAKIRFEPRLTVIPDREGTWSCSIPNIMVQSPQVFEYLAEAPESTPESNFFQRALDAGEPVAYREYPAPVFEIDTLADLEEARTFLAGPLAADAARRTRWTSRS